MSEAYKNEEIRLIQERVSTSAADALYINIGTVPEGKIWTVTCFGYRPSVAETQVVSFQKVTRAGTTMALLNPISLNLNPAYATFIEQGMSYQLFPNEYIFARRVAATGGSTMSLWMQFIESDLPIYTYEEPQIVKRTARALSNIRQRMSGGGSLRGGGGEAPGGPGGGGRGRPFPV